MVWEDSELQREQVRGVFALGVIASIIAYLTYGSNLKIPTTNALATNLFAFLDVASFILISNWGIYIVSIAISMTFWSPRTKAVETALISFKRLGRTFFYLGSFSTLAFGLYYVPLLYFEAFQTMNLATQVFFAAIFVLAIVVFGSVYVRSFLRRWKFKHPPQLSGTQEPKVDRPNSNGQEPTS